MSNLITLPAAPGAAQASRFAGTLSLIRFALRRDRIRLPVWLGVIVFWLVYVAAVFPPIYPDAAARQARAVLMSNPGAVIIGGPGISLDNYTFGAMMINEMFIWAAVPVAIISIFTVIRHTRKDEEAGRTELMLASPVGRHAPLAAALTVAAGANVLLAVLTAIGLASLRLESIDWPGSWLYGAAIATMGLFFAAVAAVAAQVSEYGRGASAIALLGLGVAFVLRAVGDVAAEPVSWLSPLGWGQRTYAYVDNRWWPLLIALAGAALIGGLAFMLGRRRDLGAGLRAPKPGRRRASPALASPPGLAARLQRTAVLGWTGAFFGFGLVYGTVMNEVEGFSEEMEAINDILGQFSASDIFTGYVSLLVVLFAIVASIYALIAMLRAQAEERAGRAEAVLATPVSRTKWLFSNVAVAILGSGIVLFAGVVGLGLSGSATLGDITVLRDLLAGSAVQLAPIVLLVAVAAALYGLLPAATGAVWVLVAYATVVGMLGGLLGLPQWAMDLSPHALVPMLPAEPFRPLPVLGMLAVAAVLFAAGWLGLRRRDIQSNG